MKWLIQLQTDIVNKEFINLQRSENELKEFFNEVKKSYQTIFIAQQTEELAIVKETVKTKITALAEYTYKYCEAQVMEVVKNAEETNTKFMNGEIFSKEQFDKFGIIYKTLKVMLVNFDIGNNKV